MKKVFVSCLVLLLGLMGGEFVRSAQAQASLSIGNYQFQSQRRVGRFDFEYTFRADVTNNGSDNLADVVGTVTSSRPGVTVVDNTLNFGTINSGQTQTSSDTFTLRINRRIRFNPNVINWTYQFNVVQTSPDDDNDGVTIADGDCDDNDPNVFPGATEVCNGIDDNCANGIDEGFTLGGSCSAGTGECQNAGVIICSADGLSTQCDAVAGTPGTETCDGLDNDCDGTLDNGFVLGGSCLAGTGECQNEGVVVCSADGLTTECNAVPLNPTDELCDGLDNNCNGTPDDGLNLGATCTVGVGECQVAGTLICAENTVGTVCNAIAGTPGVEVCDGLDNNCDGVPDETFGIGNACTVGQGICENTGTFVCSIDGLSAICDAIPGQALANEICGNNLDDNCNGVADEGCTVQNVPPDPSTVATTIDETESFLFPINMSFLYEGTDPIQTGVDPTQMDPIQMAVVRGTVYDANGNPLPGVTVSVKDHPQFGQTLTRADGMFDLAVNGGGQMTIDFMLQDYLPGQRSVDVPWQDFIFVDDIIMVQLDPRVTTINATVGGVGQGTPVVDQDGTRQASVIFPSGTTAEIVLPDGTTQSLTNFNFRATEYTVGQLGPVRMPGNLPATSAYTYAVEFTLDEALALGSTRVNFNQPLPFYMENFLSMPVGVPVPVGYYDQDLAQWVPSEDGQVVGIVSITNNLADVDTTGDGIADNGLGITTEERQRLASLYSVGESLWRTPISHFTPWDCNFPYGAPNDAIPPNGDEPIFDLNQAGASAVGGYGTIDIENQTFREMVNIAGTPYSLNYSSNRVEGRESYKTVKIPLSGSSIPASLKSIQLNVYVAGRSFNYSFSPQANRVFDFSWDGRDGYGRPVPGTVKATARIGFVYDAVYQEPNPGIDRPFFGSIGGPNLVGNRARRELISFRTVKFPIGGRGESFNNNAGLGLWSISTHHAYDPSNQVLYTGDGNSIHAQDISNIITTVAGIPSKDTCCFDPADLYCVVEYPQGNCLQFNTAGCQELFQDFDLCSNEQFNLDDCLANNGGDPTLCESEQFDLDDCVAYVQDPSYFEDIESTAADYCATTDSIVQNRTILAADIAPDGTIYFVEDNALYKLVGVDQRELVVDDMPSALFMGISPDGQDIYVSSFIRGTRGSVVWKVDPVARTKTLFAGTEGVRSNTGDGGLAINATLSNPTDIEVSPDGSVYIATGNCIRKVLNNGIIQQFAGTCDTPGFFGDGGPATSGLFWSISGLDIGPDGSVYVADTANHRIRRIDPSGIVTTVAGSGPIGFSWSNVNYAAQGIEDDGQGFIPDPIYTAGDGGAATSAILPYPRDVVIDDQGNLFTNGGRSFSGIFVAGALGGQVRRIDPNGEITTFAGNGTNFGDTDFFSDPTLGDGGSAFRASIGVDNNRSIFIGPDDALYLVDGRQRLRKIAPMYKGFDTADIAIPSQDGQFLFRFNANGKHLETRNSITDATLLTFDYDGNNRLSRITDPDGNQTNINRTGAGVATSIQSPFGVNTTLNISNGKLNSVTNAENETVAFQYSSDGLLERVTTPLNDQFTMQYDGAGRLTRVNDPEGGQVSLNRTELTTTSYQVTSTSVSGATSTYRLDNNKDGTLNTKTITYRDGTTETLVVNPNGQTVNTLPDGSVLEILDRGDIRFGLQVLGNRQTSLITPNGLQLTTDNSQQITYQTLGDPTSPIATLVELTDVNGNVRETSYDNVALIKTTRTANFQQAEEGFDQIGRTTFAGGSLNTPTNFFYDSAGRLEQVRRSNGVQTRSETFSYATTNTNQPDSLTNSEGQTVTFIYDGVGRLLTRTLADGRSTAYEYDANENLVGVTPPGRSQHQFDYNGNGQMIRYTPPAVAGIVNPATVYDYTVDRQIDQVTRPDGSIIDYQYDAFTRLEQVVTPEGSIINTYDANGRVASTTHPTGQVLTYAYDGPLSTAINMTGIVSGNVGYTYDNNFWVRSHTINGGNTINYTYNDDGRVTQAGDLSVNHINTARRFNQTTIDSVQDDYTYNTFGEVSNYNVQFNNLDIYDVTYTYDSIGRITRAEEVISGVPTIREYAYDSTNRLTEVRENAVITETFIYDGNGNRLTTTDSSGTHTGTYDAQDRVLTYGNNTYTHNDVGDLTVKNDNGAITQYQYDVFGSLRQVTLPNATTINYIVDGLNRRVGKQVNGSLTQGFLYADGLQVIAELDAANNIVSQFIYANYFNAPAYMVKNGVKYKIIADLNSSVRLVVNTLTGAIAQRLDYDAYGRVLVDTNPGFQPFGFGGGIYDTHTGLVRLGARDYDAETGRFTRKDPIHFEGLDLNLYGYAFRNPVNFVDPLGQGPSLTDFFEAYPIWSRGVPILNSSNGMAGGTIRAINGVDQASNGNGILGGWNILSGSAQTGVAAVGLNNQMAWFGVEGTTAVMTTNTALTSGLGGPLTIGGSTAAANFAGAIPAAAAAGVSIDLAADSIQAAQQGKVTPVDVAFDYYKSKITGSPPKYFPGDSYYAPNR